MDHENTLSEDCYVKMRANVICDVLSMLPGQKGMVQETLFQINTKSNNNSEFSNEYIYSIKKCTLHF